MAGYNERDFVRALVPLLIARLPDPLSPTEDDMRRVAEAAGRWSELLVDLRTDSEWVHFLLDHDGPAWNEPDDSEG
jgi:hypothetical protein